VLLMPCHSLTVLFTRLFFVLVLDHLTPFEGNRVGRNAIRAVCRYTSISA
jgi:hypothetical protein